MHSNKRFISFSFKKYNLKVRTYVGLNQNTVQDQNRPVDPLNPDRSIVFPMHRPYFIFMYTNVYLATQYYYFFLLTVFPIH